MDGINKVVLYCIVSYRIVSYRIVSYRIVLYCIKNNLFITSVDFEWAHLTGAPNGSFR